MDDLIKAIAKAFLAIKLLLDVAALLLRAGFVLTKFISNCREVLKALPRDKLSPALQAIDFDKDLLPDECPLGQWWNMEKDEFFFKADLPDKDASKRGLLATFCSPYDQLGIVIPTFERK